MHVHAPRPRRRELAEQLLRLAPAPGAGELEMRHLDMDAALLADVYGLRHRLVDAVALVAHMARIAPAMRLHHPAERQHLLRLRIAAGRGEQAGGKPERARLQRLGQHLLHVPELGVRGVAVLHAHRHQPQRVVPGLHDGVQRKRRPCVHVAGEVGLLEGQPGRARREVVAQHFHPAGQGGRNGEAAIADHLGRHALADLAFRLRVERQGEVGMGVDVDEAGGDGQAVCVDHPFRAARIALLDGLDAPVPERHVGLARGRPGPVHDLAAPDENVVHPGVLQQSQASAGRIAQIRPVSAVLSSRHDPPCART